MFHGDLPYVSKDIIKKFETLNEEHIIGCGGFGTVYKLAMDDGNVFALKRIVKLNEGFDRFFERELEILGSIKHRFLVNLRGYCNSPTSKLLIYDFLPGGSLDEALHGKILIILFLCFVFFFCKGTPYHAKTYWSRELDSFSYLLVTLLLLETVFYY